MVQSPTPGPADTTIHSLISFGGNGELLMTSPLTLALLTADCGIPFICLSICPSVCLQAPLPPKWRHL